MDSPLERLGNNQDVIVFDGECVYCSRFAHLIARVDKAQRFGFVTAQSPLGRSLYEAHGLDPDAMETSITLVNGAAHLRMAAITAALAALGGPWRLVKVLDLFPRPAMSWLYDRIANNRYRLGRQTCPSPSPDVQQRILQ